MAKRIEKKKRKQTEVQRQKKALLRKLSPKRELVNVTEKQLQRASLKTLQSLTEKADKVQKVNRLKRRNERREELYNEKKIALDRMGIDVNRLTKRQIMSVKLKDIQERNINEESYPSIWYAINFDKTYILPKDSYLFFEFRDFAGERSFDDILDDFEKMTPEQLLLSLKTIVEMPHSYNKKTRSGSSGVAGDYKFIASTDENIYLFHQEINEELENKTHRKRHTGMFKGFQRLYSNGSPIIRKATPRRLLVVANAMMYNITEIDRDSFYKQFYWAMKKAIPELFRILPKPK